MRLWMTILFNVLLVLGGAQVQAKEPPDTKPSKPPKRTESEWTKHPDNPVLSSGPEDSWINLKVDPSVMKDEGVYKMWFSGNQDGTYTQVAYAESSDGIHWTMHPDPILSPGPSGSWEATDVETPSVIKDYDAPPDERYKMWYGALDDSPNLVYRIGYATSADGLNWNKDENNPVFGPPVDSDLVYGGAVDPVVVKDEGVYKMWYSASGEEGEGQFWIGHATSEDGINWEEYPANPVLDIGPGNSFESKAVGQPYVLYDGSKYHLWYSGWDEVDVTWSGEIGYASSEDGINWTKSPNNPVLGKGRRGEWDSAQVLAASVIADGEEYKMYYTGIRVIKYRGKIVNADIGIGLATSQR